MSIQNNTLPDNPNIEVIKAKQTGIFTNYIFKAIPLAFDESMSYYETLCGLLNYLKNTIIPTVNNNADAVAELQTLYEELRTFVDDYFTNLDVQEEINNKLDDMVNDGTLSTILEKYVNDLQNQINALKQNKMDNNHLINMSNLAPDVKEAITGGSVAIVGNQSVYKENIVNEQIEKEHLNMLDNEFYEINNPNYVDNHVYNVNTGEYQTNSKYCCTEMLNCELNDVLIANQSNNPNMWYALFNENKTWVKSVISINCKIDDANIKYFVFNYLNSYAGQIRILKNRTNNYYKQTLKTIDFPVANDPSRIDLINIPTNLLKGNDIAKENCNFIKHETNNMYDYRNFMYNKHFRASTGEAIDTTSEGYGCTNLIPLGEYTPDKTIFYQYKTNGFTYLFDENKNYLGFNIIDINTGSFTIPQKYSNAKYYAKAIFNNLYKEYYLIKGSDTYINNYQLDPSINVTTSSILYNKKIGFLGDSITNGFKATKPFRTLISENTGCISYNYGINQSTISNTGDTSVTNPMCLRYSKMIDNLDYICVLGGINDYFGNVPIGKTDSEDTTTFNGALNVLIKGLINKYSNKKICFLTPLNKRNASNKLIDYVNAIKERCAYFSIPVYDLYTMSGLDPNIDIINNTLFGEQDGLHPNDDGNLMFYRKIQTFLETL